MNINRLLAMPPPAGSVNDREQQIADLLFEHLPGLRDTTSVRVAAKRGLSDALKIADGQLLSHPGRPAIIRPLRVAQVQKDVTIGSARQLIAVIAKSVHACDGAHISDQESAQVAGRQGSDP